MSDILFLSVKEHAGKLRKNEGTRSTTGALATLTANTGKDMYIARAKFTALETGTGGTTKVELQINGTVVETAEIQIPNLNNVEYEFKNIGHKVAASQVIKLEVISITATNLEGFIECFEETTGESPFQSTEFS